MSEAAHGADVLISMFWRSTLSNTKPDRHRLVDVGGIITHTLYSCLLGACLTGLLLVTLNACSDDSCTFYSSKIILWKNKQVEKDLSLCEFSDKDNVNLTDLILFATIYKIIITKCSSVEKIWDFAYKLHQFTPIENIKEIWLWNANRSLQKQHREKPSLH